MSNDTRRLIQILYPLALVFIWFVWKITPFLKDIPLEEPRIQCGETIEAYTGTAATIQAALDICHEGEYVHLGAGTFILTNGITLKKAMLIGDGTDKTIVKFKDGLKFLYGMKVTP